MSTTSLTLRSINDLLKAGERFYVPAYQRGYRWTKKQVTDLLDDIWDFQRRDGKTKDEFYCLQPVVVSRRGDEWILIDGQQRLTTLLIIMNSLKPIMDMLRKVPYTIQYETRPESEGFLKSIDLNRRDENIDFHHISEALEAVNNWFSTKDGGVVFPFLNTLLQETSLGNNVQVIWYELDNQQNHVEVFTRLNVGKIPLTNAELIKAMLLRSTNFTGEDHDLTLLKQIQIASEWDQIERRLQDNAFWYFLEGDDQYPTRIELLFELLNAPRPADNHDPYYTFITFSARFVPDKSVLSIWKEVKDLFLVLEEWFQDHVLYHHIGYLLLNGGKLQELISFYKTKTKSGFQETLKSMIARLFPYEIETLAYDTDKERIRQVVLLFNIQTLASRQLQDMRFPFKDYKTMSWDIEHIRSVKASKPGRPDDQLCWLSKVLEYYTGALTHEEAEIQLGGLADSQAGVVCREIIEMMRNPKGMDEKFQPLYEKVLALFGEDKDPEHIHHLSNLALLDAHVNRSYKNAVFPIKRKVMLRIDNEGYFIPICTRNVLMKYYSQKADNLLFWQEADQKDYMAAIKSTLSPFLTHTTTA